MKIAVTGTPGVGKTSVSRKLVEKLDLEYVSVNEFARERDCIVSRDEKRQSDVVDLEKLRDETSSLKDCVLDGHLSHFLDSDKVFVLRCRPSLLRERMREKGWDEEKVEENLDAEILGVIEKEARGEIEEVYSIDTSETSEDEVVGIIINIVEGEGEKEYRQPLDWVERGEV